VRLIQQVVALAVGPVERLAHALGKSIGLLDERCGDDARTRGNRNPNLHVPRTGTVRIVRIRIGVYRRRRQREYFDAISVDADLELVRLADRSSCEQVEELDLDVVLRIARKVVGNRHAATSTERQTVAVPVL
jgi:hypothetical protein